MLMMATATLSSDSSASLPSTLYLLLSAPVAACSCQRGNTHISIHLSQLAKLAASCSARIHTANLGQSLLVSKSAWI